MTSLLALILGIAPCFTRAQGRKITGNGKIVTVTRSPGNFRSVTLTGSFDVILIRGSNPGVRLEGESNLLPEVVTVVRGGVLEILGDSQVSFSCTRALKIFVTAPALEKISLAGSGKISGEAQGLSGVMRVDLGGSGDISLKITAPDLKGSIQGSGNMKLDMAVGGVFNGSVLGSGNLEALGSAGKAHLGITGSGNISASRLNAGNWETVATGSGNIDR